MKPIIACTTCAQNFVDSNGPNAAGWSIMFLLAVILGMLVTIVFFMVRMARRENETLDPELRDDGPAPTSTH